jgi:hypothetical protein
LEKSLLIGATDANPQYLSLRRYLRREFRSGFIKHIAFFFDAFEVSMLRAGFLQRPILSLAE